MGQERSGTKRGTGRRGGGGWGVPRLAGTAYVDGEHEQEQCVGRGEEAVERRDGRHWAREAVHGHVGVRALYGVHGRRHAHSRTR